MPLCLRAVLLVVALLLGQDASARENVTPKTVLVLLATTADRPAESRFLEGLQAGVRLGAPDPVTPLGLAVEYLDLGRRQADAGHEAALQAWLQRRYADVPIAAIVTNGPAALRFATEHRDLWPRAPIVFGGLSAADLRTLGRPPDATGVTSEWDVRGTVALITRLLPDTTSIVLIAGSRERPLVDTALAQVAAMPSAPRLELLEGLSWDETLARVSTLPPDAVALAIGMSVDGRGRVLEQMLAMRIGAARANRPVFVLNQVAFGFGAVGGSLLDYTRIGEATARVLVRLLAGTPADAIPVGAAPVAATAIDARALARWGIPEARVPATADVRFRPPSLWRDHRGAILASTTAITALGVLSGSLLFERRRRAHAEAEARTRLLAMVRLHRVAAFGQLSAAIAHEVNQPLGAIHNYAQGLEWALAAPTPDLEAASAAAAAIRADARRAGDVVHRVRRLYGPGDVDAQPIVVAELVRHAAGLVRHPGVTRGVEIRVHVPDDLPPSTGDAVQLQQVLTNLLLNGLDAASGGPPPGWVSIDARRAGDTIEFAIADSGAGLPADVRAHLFDAFVTTKVEGLGMGLAIARSVVEAHGGRIWADEPGSGGAVIRFTLPAAVRA